MRRVEKEPCVYILASKRNGTLYVGVTSNLIQRVWQHKNNEVEGFTKKYQVHLLVYCEMHETMEFAITREKQLKKWNRDWKINLIEKENPEWHDLWSELVEDGFPPSRE
ncbi:MAG: GIY-YIG nuclease family protein [Erysipelotrichia bacterium]|nr:GIY-YIG nuclease family protein [Erysipelotrichia bacterium]